jgi:prepilin peptidase CpaA
VSVGLMAMIIPIPGNKVIKLSIFLLILIELAVVGWIDFKTAKISNRWLLVNAVASIVLHATITSFYPLSWEVLLFPGGLLLIGFFLYHFHIMGAGDSKYLASLFLIIPLEFHLFFFSKLVLSTILVGSTLIIIKILRNGAKLKAYFVSHYWEGIKQILKSRFSYAPVILLAWLLLGFNLWD